MTLTNNHQTKRSTVLIQVNLNKVVIKILQDSVATQTTLDGLTTYHANFLYICQKL